MKKICALVLALILASAAMFSVSAAGISASEQKIVDALDSKVKIASGYSMELPDQYINQVEDYLTQVDMSDADVNAILDLIDKAKVVVAKSNATKYSNFEDSIKDELYVLIEQAEPYIKATITLKAGYHVTIKFDDDASLGSFAGREILSDTKANFIKQTGIEGNVVLSVVAVVAVLSAAAYVVVSSRKKAESK